MKLRIGSVPEPQDFASDGGWKPLREPGPILMQLLALPLGVLTCAVFTLSWIYLTPVIKHPTASPLPLILILVLTIPVHELVHALAHPSWGRSSDTVVGVWPSRMLCYAHYDGQLSRNRFVAVLVMPLLILSAAPLALSAATGHASVSLAFASAFNALAAGGDVFAICLLLSQVPAGAIIRNRGYRTFWTSPAAA